MNRLPWMLAGAIAVVLVSPVLALGEETAPPKTPWTKTDLDSAPVVRWVFEGCAAYPVTAETMPDQPSSATLAAAESHSAEAVSPAEN
jgi:hypothetical protein